jgi:hypothetical protein
MLSAFGVDQSQQPAMNHSHGNVHPAALTLATALVGALLRVVVDKMSVFEVESMLFQIGPSLCLIPDEYDLIVATI